MRWGATRPSTCGTTRSRPPVESGATIPLHAREASNGQSGKQSGVEAVPAIDLERVNPGECFYATARLGSRRCFGDIPRPG
jgi:hypothetical protein